MLMLTIALATFAQAPDGVEAIDLGLPSGTKWANMNVGAVVPKDKGMPFAWQEIETKKEFTKYNAAFYDYIQNYVRSSSSNISGKGLDAAHVRWGGKWRMPTKGEFEELLKECSGKTEVVGGVVGMTFTGPNGHSIFMPFELRTRWNAEYWSGEREFGQESQAYCWCYTYGGAWLSTLDKRYTYEGKYIRPVMDDNTAVTEINPITLDEREDYTPQDESGIIKLTKTFFHGWNTMALPFSVSGTRLDQLFSYYARDIYEFAGFDGEVFNFRKTSRITANKPCLVYYKGPKERVTKYFGYGRGYSSSTVNGNPVSSPNGLFSFRGIYSQTDLPSEDTYYLNKRFFEKDITVDDFLNFQAVITDETVDANQGNHTVAISLDGIRITPYMLLDEESEEYPDASNGDEDVVVKIRMTAGEWNTIALPFSMNGSQLKAAFGDNVQLATFDGYMSDEDFSEMTINFKNVDIEDAGFMANQPYIIKPSKDIEDFSIHTIVNPQEEEATIFYFEELSGGYRHAMFRGIYRLQQMYDENSLLMTDGKFCYSDGETRLNAYHAYLDLKDVLQDKTKANDQIKMVIQGISTDINSKMIQTADGNATEVARYDICGQHLDAPHRGLNIMLMSNGTVRKVIVK